jgi:hypothetical protein
MPGQHYPMRLQGGHNASVNTAERESFGDVIYKIATNTLLSKLDTVYHIAIRFVTKAPYTTHHCGLYAFVGWPSLHICHQIFVAKPYR